MWFGMQKMVERFTSSSPSFHFFRSLQISILREKRKREKERKVEGRTFAYRFEHHAGDLNFGKWRERKRKMEEEEKERNHFLSINFLTWTISKKTISSSFFNLEVRITSLSFFFSLSFLFFLSSLFLFGFSSYSNMMIHCYGCYSFHVS